MVLLFNQTIQIQAAVYTKQDNLVPSKCTSRDPHWFKRVQMGQYVTCRVRVKQLKLNLEHNIVNGKAPNYLFNAFNLTCNQHSIKTISSTLSLRVPHVKSFGKTSFHYTSTQAWNKLPYNIQSAQNKYQFKCLVKQFLFNCLSN